jgi:hypothetical protein
MLLGWQAQHLAYMRELHYNLSQPALVLPVFAPAVGENAVAVIAIPAEVSGAQDLFLEARMDCEGNAQRGGGRARVGLCSLNRCGPQATTICPATCGTTSTP